MSPVEPGKVLRADAIRFDWMPVIHSASPAGHFPERSSLDQNYPNPFNGTSTVAFRIAQVADVTLRVFDLLGREVATLVDGRMSPGEYAVRFDADRLASGIYICRLRVDPAGKGADVLMTSRRMLLLR